MRISPILLSTLALAGCPTSSTTSQTRCVVTLQEATPAEAVVGESVVLVGSPMTTAWDTAVYVGSLPADVSALDRSDGCAACDTCRTDEGCTVCGDCNACDLLCATDCIESVTFAVPAEAPVGQTTLVLYNNEGSSRPLAFTVLDSEVGDGGSADGGGADGGGSDGGGADGGAR
jgi:hypothetical protein